MAKLLVVITVYFFRAVKYICLFLILLSLTSCGLFSITYEVDAKFIRDSFAVGRGEQVIVSVQLDAIKVDPSTLNFSFGFLDESEQIDFKPEGLYTFNLLSTDWECYQYEFYCYYRGKESSFSSKLDIEVSISKEAPLGQREIYFGAQTGSYCLVIVLPKCQSETGSGDTALFSILE